MITPTLADLIEAGARAQISDLFTAGPGIVQAYDANTRTADILPATQRPVPMSDESVTFEDLPIIPNVPVAFPVGGGFEIVWPLVKGDTVLLVQCTFSLAGWRRGDNSQTVEPGDLRMHALGSAVAIPTLTPDKNVTAGPTSSLDIKGALVRMGDPNSADWISDGTKTDQNFSTIINAIAGVTPGPVEPGLTALKAALAGALPSVKCANVKAS